MIFVSLTVVPVPSRRFFLVGNGEPALVISRAGGREFLERRGYAIVGFQAVVRRRLAVTVKVDKSGRDNQAFRINHLAPKQRRCGNGGDIVSGYPDVADGVQVRFRIHHEAAGQDRVVLLRE
jgi:hypothetical protein